MGKTRHCLGFSLGQSVPQAAKTCQSTDLFCATCNRVGVATSSGTTTDLWDTSLGFPSVVAEFVNGSLTASYAYGDDLISRTQSGAASYYLYDGLGSVRALTNMSGSVTNTYAYSVNPFLFDAQQYDAPTGDYYLRARYYDETTGRFLSQDPFGGDSQNPVSQHRYLYASDDPADMVDPGGEDFSLGETLVSTSISEGLRSIKNSVDLEIYQRVSDSSIFGTQGAIKNYAIGLGIGTVTIIGGTVVRGIWQKYLSNGAASELEQAAVDGLSNTVARNGLNDAEYEQAQEIADFRGGHFEGQPEKSTIPGMSDLPAIDGWINGEPASIKSYSSSKPGGLLYTLNNNVKSINQNYDLLVQHGYVEDGDQVEIYVFADNLSVDDAENFALGGNQQIVNLTKGGHVSSINIRCADKQWLRIDAQAGN